VSHDVLPGLRRALIGMVHLLPLPGSPRWGGSLEWTDTADRAARQAEAMRRFQAWGYPVHLIDQKQLRALEPNVVPGTMAYVMW